MTYGHAERTLATIRRLEAETAELLSGLDQLDPEQERWLREADFPADAAVWDGGAGTIGPVSGLGG